VAVDPTTHLVYVVSGPGGQGFISVFSGASNLPRVFGPSLIDPTAITVNPATGDVYSGQLSRDQLHGVGG
jgi:DNA-binding beta-propeller fold protein YncE